MIKHPATFWSSRYIDLFGFSRCLLFSPFLMVLIFLIGVSSPLANALKVPDGSSYDKRIQIVDYNPNDVIEINTRVGIITQIQLDPSETIKKEKAVAGYLDGWEITPEGNSLFIKAVSTQRLDEEGKQVDVHPIPGKWNTNILFSTNRRIYAVDLKLRGSRSKTAYLVKFRYPQDEAERYRKKKIAKQREVNMTKTPVVKNRQYTMQPRRKSKDIIPSHVFDDGEFTYFMFPGNRVIPAIFHVDGHKKEASVNFHIDPSMPGTVVVHHIGRQFYLRHGNAVVGVYNESFDDLGKANTTGTTVPGVKRTLKRK